MLFHQLLSKRFQFAVYYRVADDVVLVFAVLDCRWNPVWIGAKALQAIRHATLAAGREFNPMLASLIV